MWAGLLFSSLPARSSTCVLAKSRLTRRVDDTPCGWFEGTCRLLPSAAGRWVSLHRGPRWGHRWVHRSSCIVACCSAPPVRRDPSVACGDVPTWISTAVSSESVHVPCVHRQGAPQTGAGERDPVARGENAGRDGGVTLEPDGRRAASRKPMSITEVPRTTSQERWSTCSHWWAWSELTVASMACNRRSPASADSPCRFADHSSSPEWDDRDKKPMRHERFT